MKYLIILTLLIPLGMNAQNNAIYKIEPKINQEVTYKANLSEGQFLKDLSWAWDSANACFPATQQQKFTGKHVFFTGIIPAGTETSISIVPINRRSNFSLYAYKIGINEDYLVPNLPRCISCEADHKHDYNRVGKPRQNHTRTVSNFIALNNSYRIVIGVTGANKLDNGEFILKITSKKL